MTHNDDYWETIRYHTLRSLHRVIRRVNGLYAVLPVGMDQYAGTVRVDAEEMEERFHDLGFQRNWISAYKYLAGNPEWYEESSWVKRRHLFDHYQLHVIFFAEDDRTHLFAHWERNYWRHPIKHYQGEQHNVSKGVEMVQSILDSADITYTTPLEQ